MELGPDLVREALQVVALEQALLVPERASPVRVRELVVVPAPRRCVARNDVQVHLRVENTQTIFTCGYAAGQAIRVPVANHDGNYSADPDTLDRLEGEGLVAFRYCGPNDGLAEAENFNGSARAIAGIFNDDRTVLGLMPHLENATDPLLGGTDGTAFFDGLASALR